MPAGTQRVVKIFQKKCEKYFAVWKKVVSLHPLSREGGVPEKGARESGKRENIESSGKRDSVCRDTAGEAGGGRHETSQEVGEQFLQ